MNFVVDLVIIVVGAVITSVLQHLASRAFVKEYDLFNEHKVFCDKHKFYSLFI